MELQYIILAIFLSIAFYTDVKMNLIHNKLTVNAALIGLAQHSIANGWSGFLYSLSGLMVGLGVFLLLYLLKAISAGDVKLFGAIGAITGIEFVLHSSMYSILFAGLIGIIILLIRREFMSRMINVLIKIVNIVLLRDIKELSSFSKKESLRFPFMYAVIPGVITAYYYVIVL